MTDKDKSGLLFCFWTSGIDGGGTDNVVDEVVTGSDVLLFVNVVVEVVEAVDFVDGIVIYFLK